MKCARWQSARGALASLALLTLLTACGGESQAIPRSSGAAGNATTAGAGGAASKPRPVEPHGGGGEIIVAGAPSAGQLDDGGALPEIGGAGQAGNGSASEGGTRVLNEAGSASSGEGGAGGALVVGCDPIVFADAELEATVRGLVHEPTGALSAVDVADLIDLTTPSISSLQGVECLINLTFLDIGSLPPAA